MIVKQTMPVSNADKPKAVIIAVINETEVKEILTSVKLSINPKLTLMLWPSEKIYSYSGDNSLLQNVLPSRRNRILSVQLFKYDITGFLHWGFNFWNSQYSIKAINPYAVTDAGSAYPSGDPFLVYPGDNGQPIESIRIKVLMEALYDLRAMKLLESLTSKEFVMDIIEGTLQTPITFSDYPRCDEYIIETRNLINEEIKKRLIK